MSGSDGEKTALKKEALERNTRTYAVTWPNPITREKNEKNERTIACYCFEYNSFQKKKESPYKWITNICI